MDEKEFKKKLRELELQQQLCNMQENEHRAQAISIGTAGGGTTEISMRGVNGGFLWNVYQPVEVVELINQLSASIGCHIAIQPRNDFASWRGWREISAEEKLHLNGFPPFQDTLTYEQMQQGLKAIESKENTNLGIEEKENVATKKAVNKRSTKRSRTSTK